LGTNREYFDVIVAIGTVGVEVEMDFFQNILHTCVGKAAKVYHFDFADADDEFDLDAPTQRDANNVRALARSCPDFGRVLVFELVMDDDRNKNRNLGRAAAVAMLVLEQHGFKRDETIKYVEPHVANTLLLEL
jgi:hypothetical protein